jgi:hypothetical protein
MTKGLQVKPLRDFIEYISDVTIFVGLEWMEETVTMTIIREAVASKEIVLDKERPWMALENKE